MLRVLYGSSSELATQIRGVVAESSVGISLVAESSNSVDASVPHSNGDGNENAIESVVSVDLAGMPSIRQEEAVMDMVVEPAVTAATMAIGSEVTPVAEGGITGAQSDATVRVGGSGDSDVTQVSVLEESIIGGSSRS